MIYNKSIAELKKMSKEDLIVGIIDSKTIIRNELKEKKEELENNFFNKFIKEKIKIVRVAEVEQYHYEKKPVDLNDIFIIINQDFNWLNGLKEFSYSEFKSNLLRYHDKEKINKIFCGYYKSGEDYLPDFRTPINVLKILCERKLIKQKGKKRYVSLIDGKDGWKRINFFEEIKKNEGVKDDGGF